MVKALISVVVLGVILGFGLVHALQSPTFSEWRAVVVQPGQDPWLLGETYCPQADTRDVVAAIDARNHIQGDIIQPGQTLWIPTKASSR